MKVLDMLGSQVPVCAFRYPAIGELVVHGCNGCVFGSSEELKEHIMRLLIRTYEASGEAVDASVDSEETQIASIKRGKIIVPAGVVDPDDNVFSELSRLSESAGEIGCWEDNWSAVVGPLLDDIMREIIR